MLVVSQSRPIPSHPTTAFQRPKEPVESLSILDGLLETPYTTIPVNRSFVTTADPIVLPLLQAVALRDNHRMWAYYTDLYASGQLKLLTRSHFSQIIRSFRPRDFYANYDASKREFVEKLNSLKGDMTDRGYALTVAEWNHILDCGRALKWPEQTQDWWEEMTREGVAPDVFSFNNYLSSLCGAAPSLQKERPVGYIFDHDGNITYTNPKKPPSETINTTQRFPLEGMSSLATDILSNMLSRKITPNAHTYELVITAHARDNNVDAINEIVERVWGFTSDGKPTPTSPLVGEPKQSSTRSISSNGSPFWPTQHTLNAIANAYGYNGALGAAIQLIDSMSNRFSIPIPPATWLSLLVWSSRCSTIYQRPYRGFISPLAAPRLFKTMTSEPYSLSPGVEAYWLMINHENRRLAKSNLDRLLVDVIKRYGPNGTDLIPEMAHIASRTLQGVKNWVPVLCDRVSRSGDKQWAIDMFKKWQYRFHLIEKTGLMRDWDEIDESQKTDIEGIFNPPTHFFSSFATRTKLAGRSVKRRMAHYLSIRRERMKHYPASWRGPGKPLFLPPGANLQFGLGSPSRYFIESHELWQEQVRGRFGGPGDHGLGPRRRFRESQNKGILRERRKILGIQRRGAKDSDLPEYWLTKHRMRMHKAEPFKSAARQHRTNSKEKKHD
jgi:hypothetical protein